MDKTFVWTYDNVGNITSRKEYAYIDAESAVTGTPTATYTYAYGDDSWGDLLTAYNGVPRTYDEIGNLLTDGTWTYTWQNGRELAAMTDGTTTWSYTYDANGMRTSRTNGTTTYNYVYNGSQLTQMTVGNDTLYFTYGILGPNTVTWNGVTYYYTVNAQGDVTGILDSAGDCVVFYYWDNGWGYNPIPDGPLASTLGTLNPLRYRGYVYDTETGYYYLQSRYYDPEIGRFINADTFAATGQGVLGNNMFAYCGNNPVSRIDSIGYFRNTIIGAVAGAIVGGISAAISGTNITAGIVSGALSGAVSGAAVDIAIATGGVGLVALASVALASGAGGATSSYVNQRMNGKAHDEVDWGTVAIDGVWGAVGGALSFGTADVGGKMCKTLAENLALKGKALLGQIGSDFATALTIAAGTWLNGTRMNLLREGQAKVLSVY